MVSIEAWLLYGNFKIPFNVIAEIRIKNRNCIRWMSCEGGDFKRNMWVLSEFGSVTYFGNSRVDFFETIFPEDALSIARIYYYKITQYARHANVSWYFQEGIATLWKFDAFIISITTKLFLPEKRIKFPNIKLFFQNCINSKFIWITLHRMIFLCIFFNPIKQWKYCQ